MTLPASGSLSMSQVNTELGNPSTAQLNLNNSSVRTLAGISSGAIAYSNLRGKSGYTSTLYTFAQGTSTFTVPSGMKYAQFVIVAGGGGGGQSDLQSGFKDGGGGGGAGGVAISPKISVTPGSAISITVGAGGSGGYRGQGGNGNNTSVTVNGSTYTVYGGGGGGGSIGGTGQHLQQGQAGGSGGGSNGTNVVSDSAIPGRILFADLVYLVQGGAPTKGSATGWQLFGNIGGGSCDNGLNGGGGGAGTYGNPGGTYSPGIPMQVNPTGGTGINPSDYGFPVSIPNTYVGGGGGAGGSGLSNINDGDFSAYGVYLINVNTYNFRGGGQGGGGDGGIGIIGISGTSYGTAGSPGTSNTGGGGGGAGGGGAGGAGGAGGSGVVYIYGTST